MEALDVTDASVLVSRKRSELGAIFRDGGTSIPDGRGRGTVLIGTGGLPARAVAVIAYALAWRGKIVDRPAGRLKNLLTPLSVPAIAAKVYEDASWYDGKDCVVLDYSSTSFVARRIRDEIREVGPGVFLGMVFVGRRHALDFALDFTGRDGSH